MCAVCPKSGDPRAVSRSPTAKTEEQGEERKGKARGSSHWTQRHDVMGWKLGTRYYCMSCVGREGLERRHKICGVKDGRAISDGFVGEGISVARGGTKETQEETGSLSVHTVNSTHLLRRSPDGSVGIGRKCARETRGCVRR